MAQAQQPPEQPRREGLGLNAILFFGFGIAAGILIAFSGIGYIEQSAELIATVFLAALLAIMLVGVLVFAARRLIWERLFGFADVQIEQLATPLATVADRAIARDPAGATAAARDLVAMAFARYAWITTRRWIITSLTALIAAMAALAGTALLFKQNQLIENQSGLLKEQNARISDQTALVEYQVQLAEADRNAQIAAGITQIAAELGTVVDRVGQEYKAATGKAMDNLFNAIQIEDVPRALVMRITSTSRAAKPYRFLDLGQRANSLNDKTRIAVARRRDELPNTYARIAQANGWTEAGPDVQLIDRPASPERGQLLSTLLASGLINLEPLNSTGLDMSYAHLLNANIILVTAQGGIFDNADFTGSHIVQSDLGGTSMENARFRNCSIRESSFAEVTAERLRKPHIASMAPMSTRATGADFSMSYINATAFTNAQLLAANFDGALLVNTDFSTASLGLSTFRNAILLSPIFKGADLKSADFDGAILFGTDVLAQLATDAAPGRFAADRFTAAPVTREEIMKIPVVLQNLELTDIDRLSGGAPAWRIKRVQPFDDGEAPRG